MRFLHDPVLFLEELDLLGLKPVDSFLVADIGVQLTYLALQVKTERACLIDLFSKGLASFSFEVKLFLKTLVRLERSFLLQHHCFDLFIRHACLLRRLLLAKLISL